MKSRTDGALLVMGLLALGVLTSVAAARDVVEFNVDEGQKQQLVGEITKEGWRAVRIEFERDGETKTAEIPRDRIVTVEHGDKPQSYSRALRQLRANSFEDAYSTFTQISQDPPSGEQYSWVEPYALYYAGQAAYKRAQAGGIKAEDREKYYNQAAEEFAKLRGQFPDHRFAPRASLKLARARVESGQLSDASGLLDDIADSDYPERVKKAARVVEARLQLARDNAGEAIEIIKSVREEADAKLGAVRYEAMMVQAEAHASLDEAGQAEGLWWEVAVRADDERMRARACMKRGLSLKKRGRLREALYTFLRVVVLHTDQAKAHQRALYHAALSAREYYEGNKRAEELASDLYSRYPQSEWTEKLREEMKSGSGSGS